MSDPRTGHAGRRGLLIVAFALALGLAGVFAVRLAVHTVYWSTHRNEPIQEWMTVGYVAHAYDVPAYDLYQSLGLPAAQADRRTLREIAAARGTSFEEVRSTLVRTIGSLRGDPPPAPAGRLP